MMELPKVFANKINKDIDNTQNVFYSQDRGIKSYRNGDSIIKKINSIFASSNHVYKSKVKIETRDGIKEKIIVGKTNVALITINGELIKINDIINIEKI